MVSSRVYHFVRYLDHHAYDDDGDDDVDDDDVDGANAFYYDGHYAMIVMWMLHWQLSLGIAVRRYTVLRIDHGHDQMG